MKKFLLTLCLFVFALNIGATELTSDMVDHSETVEYWILDSEK